MVQINIWFIPRSRSTALVKSLSQIPDSKVFFETFLWAFYLGDEDSMVVNHPELVGPKAPEHIVPGYNHKSALKTLRDCEAKVKIVKDFAFALRGKYDDVITKDSINVFLCRDPKYVFTSFLPTSQMYFYHITKQNHSDVTVHYREMLNCIQYVQNNCDVAPIVVDGSHLSTREKSIEVVKTICDKAGIDFSESLLSWEATEGLDPNWESPKPASTVNLVLGFFARVNNSTSFEDVHERDVNLEELKQVLPDMVADIELCKPWYDKIIATPNALK